jgi:hypothetical protein
MNVLAVVHITEIGNLRIFHIYCTNILYECRLCDKSKNWFKLSGNINGDAIGVVATVFYSMLHELN